MERFTRPQALQSRYVRHRSVFLSGVLDSEPGLWVFRRALRSGTVGKSILDFGGAVPDWTVQGFEWCCHLRTNQQLSDNELDRERS